MQYNPVRVLSGPGCRTFLTKYLPSGTVLLLTTTGMLQRGTAEELMRSCSNINWIVRLCSDNPDVDTLDQLALELADTRIKALVALGGGSVLDTGKALSLLLANPNTGSLSEWLRSPQKPSLPLSTLPLFCLPSTAGTGAEVTPFATIWDHIQHKKHSLKGEQLFPKLALVDPELTVSLPWEITLFTALDTLSHALETLWNRHVTPSSAALATQALRFALILPQIETHPKQLSYRESMQQASLLAGLAISQNRTALAHALSYPLTLHYKVPHGLACGFSLPAIMMYVEKVKAWKYSPDKALLAHVKALIERYNLVEYLLGYSAKEQIRECLKGELQAERMDNFVMKLNEKDINFIISKIFNDKKGKK